MERFFAALRFLTILPIPGRIGTTEKALEGSLPFFPVVGLLIGAVASVCAVFFTWLLPPMISVILVNGVLVAASGGMHMDGLADCADGLFSARSRKRILEIMRDSHIGTMGVIAIIFILMLKMAALAFMTEQQLWRGVLLMPVSGRVAIWVSMAMVPYARPEGGLGALFYREFSRLTALWGLAFLGVCAWLAAGNIGVFISLGVMGIIGFFNWWCFLKIGGATGDTLGAACELAETVTIVVFAAIVHSS